MPIFKKIKNGKGCFTKILGDLTWNDPMGKRVVLSRVSNCASPNLDISCVKFDNKLTFEDHVRGIICRVHRRIGILRLVKRVFVDTSMLLRCYSAFVLIFMYCSPVWGLLLNVIFSFSSSWCIRRPGFALIGVTCRCQCMVYEVNSNANHCMFSELSRCRTSQFARCFLPAQARMRNNLTYAVFDTGTLYVFYGVVNRWLLPGVVFFSFPWRRCLWG